MHVFKIMHIVQEKFVGADITFIFMSNAWPGISSIK